MKHTSLDSLIEDLRPRLPDYLALHGINTTKNFSCITGAHKDTHPSMTCKKYPSRAKCFSCSTTVDIFQAAHLLEKKPIRGSDFVYDNVFYLADKLGVSYALAPPNEADIKRKRVLQAYEAVSELLSVSPPNELLDTFLSARELTLEQLHKHLIGSTSLNSIETLLTTLGLEDIIVEAGLNDALLFAPNRLTFTLLNSKHQVVSFISRALDNSEPRYYHMPSLTDLRNYITSHSSVMYGEHLLEKTASKVLIVEGHTDALALWEKGLTETVAIGGLALRASQLARIKAAGKYILTLCVDNDIAGNNFLKHRVESDDDLFDGLDITVKQLTSCKDPEEFIRTHGIKAFKALPEIPWLDFCISTLASSGYSPEQVCSILLSRIARLSRTSTVRAYQQAKRLSEITKVSYEAVITDLKSQIKKLNETGAERLKQLVQETITSLKENPATAGETLSLALSKLDKVQLRDIDESPEHTFVRFLDITRKEQEAKESIFEGFRFDPNGLGMLENVLAGPWKSGKFIALGGKENVGKCIAFDSQVYTHETGYETLQELYEKNITPKTLSASSNNKIKVTQCKGFYNDGIKPVAKVTTYLGTYLESTASHKWLTLEGWKPQQDLTTEDYIATPLTYPDKPEFPIEDDQIRLLAYFMCEGIKNRIAISNTDKEIIEDFKSTMSKYFGHTPIIFDEKSTKGSIICHWPRTRDGRTVFNKAKRWLANHNLWGTLAKDKMFPKTIWLLSQRQKAVFLGAALDCDGWYSISKQDKCLSIGYTSASESLAYSMHLFLLSLGLPNKFRYKQVKLKGKLFDSWLCEITSLVYAARLLSDLQVPSLCKKQKQNAIQKRIDESCNRSFYLRGPQGCYRTKQKEDILFVKVRSISKYTSKQVYDLTVPELQNFTANGLIVHNSALVTQMGYEVVSHPDNNATFIHWTIDDSAEEILPRYVCLASGQLNLEMNHITNPHYYAKLLQNEHLVQHRDMAFSKIRELALDGRIIVRDATHGKTLTYLRHLIQETKARFPERKILVCIDNLHNVTDWNWLQGTERMTNVSKATKDLCTEEQVSIIATVEYRKLARCQIPSNEDLADTRALKYDSNVIFHLYNDMHERGSDQALILNESTAQPLPRVLFRIGKNKVCSFKGEFYMNLYPAHSRFSWVDFDIATKEKNARAEKLKGTQPGVGTTKASFYIPTLDNEYKDDILF